MTYTDYYIIATFVVMLFFIKNYYEKYSSASKLIKSFIKELNHINKANQSLSADNSLLEVKLDSLNNSLKANKELIQTLKTDLITQKTNFDLDFSLLKKEHQLNLKDSIELARKDALKKSRSILRGQASEHLAPYVIPNTNPKDYRFMGNPVDYICFEGLSDLLDNKTNEISSVKFIDIKTGKSSLNKSQRKIRDAIKANKVNFEVINLDDEMQKQNNTESEEN
jgi:predicted Holliday junction resolvase-like endonuclease